MWHVLCHSLLWWFSLRASQGSSQIEESALGPTCDLGRKPGPLPTSSCLALRGSVLALGVTVSQQQPRASVRTLLKYTLSWQVHTCCVSGQHTHTQASCSENKTMCEIAKKADACIEIMSELQVLTLPFQRELKSLNQQLAEGFVPCRRLVRIPALFSSPFSSPL